jgi:hypothetical protein
MGGFRATALRLLACFSCPYLVLAQKDSRAHRSIRLRRKKDLNHLNLELLGNITRASGYHKYYISENVWFKGIHLLWRRKKSSMRFYIYITYTNTEWLKRRVPSKVKLSRNRPLRPLGLGDVRTIGSQLTARYWLLVAALTVQFVPHRKHTHKVKLSCNRPLRPIGLWDVKVPTLSRQSAHRWR